MDFCHCYLLGCCLFGFVNAYRNNLFTIAKFEQGKTREYKCAVYEGVSTLQEGQGDHKNSLRRTSPINLSAENLTETTNSDSVENPFEVYQDYLHKFLYGQNIESDEPTTTDTKLLGNEEQINTSTFRHYVIDLVLEHPTCKNKPYKSQGADELDKYWRSLEEKSVRLRRRSELFNNRSGVHLPLVEFMHRGHCDLKITNDYMQTAVNAFAIFLYGTLDDIERLPADYVLRSARTISMMKIAREKLAATWDVVRAGKATQDISHLTLEMYRPLFKYISGREMARLNLSDERILTYIGTHAELNRHQVGVVANRYIELNKDWSKPMFLNIMNNLLCGVPMTFMRRLPISTYLQLSHQVFYHIRACDPLQRRFYLAMMTRTKALGKSFSWNARDVSRLGLLLTEVEGNDLCAINPEAMVGLTAQVILHMSPQSLQYLSENQLKYLAPKPLNILGRKLKIYNDQLQIYGSGFDTEFILLNKIILFMGLNTMYSVISL